MIDFNTNETFRICSSANPGGVPGDKSSCGLLKPKAIAFMDGDVYFSTKITNQDDDYAIMKIHG